MLDHTDPVYPNTSAMFGLEYGHWTWKWGKSPKLYSHTHPEQINMHIYPKQRSSSNGTGAALKSYFSRWIKYRKMTCSSTSESTTLLPHSSSTSLTKTKNRARAVLTWDSKLLDKLGLEREQWLLFYVRVSNQDIPSEVWQYTVALLKSKKRCGLWKKTEIGKILLFSCEF